MSKVHGSSLGRIADNVVSFVSGEWILEWTPSTTNGGTVVSARSLWLSAWVYLAAFLLKTRFGEGKIGEMDLRQGAADLVDTLPWFAAIFGAVYAALYTRFSSQWNYLANLFNQIVQSQLAMSDDDAESRLNTMASWKAAFIEDAQDLHLAAKPMFLVAVAQWGSDERVANKFASNTVGGKERLEALLRRLQAIRDQAGNKVLTAAEAQALDTAAGETGSPLQRPNARDN